jgi:SAM-dependent methyltransferase
MSADPVTIREILAAAITGVLPVKYAYLGRGAEIHDSYSRTEQYAASNGRHNSDGRFLQDNLALARKPLERILDIGPGNGQRSAKLIECLVSEFEMEIARHDGIDNSAPLAETARAELAGVLGNERVHFLIRDVEAPGAFAKLSAELGLRDVAAFAMILGNTLGNVASPGDVLSELSKSLSAGSLVFFTLAASSVSDGEKIATLYDSDLFKDGIVSGLVYAGVPPESLRVEISYEHTPFPSAVGTAILSNEARLFAGEERFVLPKGHSIRCFQSRRFGSTEVDELLGAADLRLISKRMGREEGVWRCLAIR